MLTFLKQLFAKKSDKIIAARVDKIDPHSNADRLRIITLFDGKQTITPVVCGAFNFSEGDVVALALPGAHIPQNMHSATHESYTLEKKSIRGVESQGMICAAFELGLASEPGEGIMVLSASTPLGSPVKY